MTKTLFKGTICRVFIQCKNPVNGLYGDFLSTAHEGEKNTPECVASPHFLSLPELYDWMHEKGFVEVDGTIATKYLSPAIEVEV